MVLLFSSTTEIEGLLSIPGVFLSIVFISFFVRIDNPISDPTYPVPSLENPMYVKKFDGRPSFSVIASILPSLKTSRPSP